MNNSRTTRSSRARLGLTLVAIFAVVAVFAVRLIDIQIVRADELSTAGVQNRSIPVVEYGTRGSILDTNGVVLASSVNRFDITVSPNLVTDTEVRAEDGTRVKITVDEVLAQVAAITGGDAAAMKASVDAALAINENSNFAYLVKGVKLQQFLDVVDIGVSWIYSEPRQSRTYPNGAVAGNMVGFMGTDGAQAGVELSADDCLSAVDGTSTYERGMDGVKIPGSTVTTEEAVNGGNVTLTIDSDLNWFAQKTVEERAKAIGANWATAIVVRVTDGHLMAVADWPTVDPNDVNSADVSDLGSRSFSTPYEPGSTFKPMTVASLLDAGVARSTDRFTVPGIYDKNGEGISDSWGHDDLKLTTAGILMNSSNIGISLLSEKLNKQARHDYLLKFGLNEKTAVDFNGESAGLLRPADEWDPITDKTVQFGQGVSATSAQVASIYQTLGNGGVKMPLTLVEGCENADGTVTDLPSAEGERVVSEAAADATVRMMETVVTDGWLSNVLPIPGYRVAAKTGTAEVAENGVYTGERIVSVAGIAPADDPQYAVVVTYGYPDTIKTSGAAAPSFQKIMAQVLKKYRVVPSTTPATDIPLTW